MKDWITELVEQVMAWIAFFREIATRVNQIAASMVLLERDLDRMIEVAVRLHRQQPHAVVN